MGGEIISNYVYYKKYIVVFIEKIIMDSEKVLSFYMRPKSRLTAIILNIILWPFGFYYLKDLKRFFIFALISIIIIPLVSFLIWLIPESSYGLVHLGIIFIGLFLFWYILIFQTIKSWKIEENSKLLIFRKPHSYWFIPVYILCISTFGSYIDEYRMVSAKNMPSIAMEPNIQAGDLFFVNNYVNYGNLNRGDFIVNKIGGFDGYENTIMIKRLIGLPSEFIEIEKKFINFNGRNYIIDRIKIDGKDIETKINNDKQDLKIGFKGINRNYLIVSELLGDIERLVVYLPVNEKLTNNQRMSIVLKNDEYFVLGDNRDDAFDSRHHGPIKKGNILGKYMYTYFSIFWDYSKCKDNLEEKKKNNIFEWVTTGCPIPELRNNNLGKVSI